MQVKPLELTASQKRFISSEIKSGRYRDENEVLQAGITLLQRQRTKRKKQSLAEMVQAGIDQADAGQGVRLTSRVAVTSHTKILLKKAEKQLREE